MSDNISDEKETPEKKMTAVRYVLHLLKKILVGIRIVVDLKVDIPRWNHQMVFGNNRLVTSN